MKRTRKTGFLLLVLLCITATSFSQKYMDDIAIESCECLNTVPDTLDPELFNTQLGLCMLEAAAPYKKQLKKDYGIDFDKIDTQGQELGQIIGLKMISFCPEALMAISARANEDVQTEDTEYVFEGQVSGIEAQQFVVFSVKDSSGKISKFYWLTFIFSDIELSTEYNSLLDESVKITYYSQEVFDSRIGEYRSINIIQKLELQCD